ncbi:hypothetical protein P43SY_004505 [Pythium insidiosum]|uniref:Uncharacterized protein n=1 Tax=Pythium insidiosum TaxID=114742 RepID=A0AAD5LJK6_PYTIN|nr:hypothetical protein P43SY_004505 [Pythium insidiosum]
MASNGGGNGGGGYEATTTMLVSTNEVNLSVLNVLGTFEQLSHREQKRLYLLSRAVGEAQKLAFLQSSAESPAILLLFQELFCSPVEDLSPGELILDLQKACVGKGLSGALPKFFKYVVLFYHNFGNYDLVSGQKFLPELPSFEFVEIVSTGRAFRQHRGKRLQQRLDACLDAIYRRTDTPDQQQQQHAIVPLVAHRVHPFYGPDVAFLDVVRVDRALAARGLSRLNTRVLRTVQPVRQRVVFAVLQGIISSPPAVNEPDESTDASTDEPQGGGDHEDNAGSSSNPSSNSDGGAGHKTETAPSGLASTASPVETLELSDRETIQVFHGDFEYFLRRIVHLVKRAAVYDRSSHVFADAIAQSFADGSHVAQQTLQRLWLQGESSGSDDDRGSGASRSTVEYFFGSLELPEHRDPAQTRGAVESYVATRNPFYQYRMDSVLRERGLLSRWLSRLPFHAQMQPLRLDRRVECVDLVLSGRRSSALPRLLSSHAMRHDGKLIYLANCAEQYPYGVVTSEKRELLDSFFSRDDARMALALGPRVAFLRFVLEDVVAPETMAAPWREQDAADEGVVLLPAELLEDESDSDIETDSDRAAGVDDDPFWRLDPYEQHCLDEDEVEEALTADDKRPRSLYHTDRAALLQRCSQARRPTCRYGPNEGFEDRFEGRLGIVLEECRRILVGVLLVLRRDVCTTICGQWTRAAPVSAPVGAAEDGSGPRRGRAQTSTRGPDFRDDRVALEWLAAAYVLQLLRGGMLARYMAMLMLCRDPSDQDFLSESRWRPRVLPRELPHSVAVARVIATTAASARDSTHVANGVPAVFVREVRVAVSTSSAPLAEGQGRSRSWRYRLRLHVRAWLQQLQWIQLTGDRDAGQRFLSTFARLTDDAMRLRDFVLLRLGDPVVRRREAEIAAGGRRGKANNADDEPMGSGTGKPPSGATQPVEPVEATDVRVKVSAIRNASSLGQSTVWIAPFLRLAERSAGGPTVVHANRQAHLSDTPPQVSQDPSAVRQPAMAMALGGAHGDDKEDEEDGQDPPHRVELRVFPPDLSYAVESAVLNVGVISDTEAEQAFRVPMKLPIS